MCIAEGLSTRLEQTRRWVKVQGGFGAELVIALGEAVGAVVETGMRLSQAVLGIGLQSLVAEMAVVVHLASLCFQACSASSPLRCLPLGSTAWSHTSRAAVGSCCTLWQS
jgi:hypothetical protein